MCKTHSSAQTNNKLSPLFDIAFFYGHIHILRLIGNRLIHILENPRLFSINSRIDFHLNPFSFIQGQCIQIIANYFFIRIKHVSRVAIRIIPVVSPYVLYRYSR